MGGWDGLGEKCVELVENRCGEEQKHRRATNQKHAWNESCKTCVERVSASLHGEGEGPGRGQGAGCMGTG